MPNIYRTSFMYTQTKGNIHKKRFYYQKNRNCLETIQKKGFLYQKNQDLILKRRTQSEERVLLNRKTGIANAKKI